MAKLFLIGDEDTVLGFRFAGLRGHVAKDGPAAAELFRKAVQDTEVSIVVITERIARLIRSHIDAFMEKRPFPFVVEIPDSAWLCGTAHSLDALEQLRNARDALTHGKRETT